jgi:hypothetical protein
MTRASGVALALLLTAPPVPAGAAETAVTADRLAGATLSAVAYVAREAGMPGGGELARIMLQAYLRPGGQALVRAWDPARNTYTATVERDWSLDGAKFCLGLPAAPRQLCADIHVWGPRIAGIGIRPYAMLDGDLQPGNALTGR